MTEFHPPKVIQLWAGLLIFSGLAPFSVAASAEADALTVHFDDGVVSVTATDVAVGDVVAAIAEQAGLRLVQHVELDRLVTLDIDSQSLPEAIVVVLENDSYALYQSPQSDADDIPSTLWVFSVYRRHRSAAIDTTRSCRFRERQQSLRAVTGCRCRA